MGATDVPKSDRAHGRSYRGAGLIPMATAQKNPAEAGFFVVA